MAASLTTCFYWQRSGFHMAGSRISGRETIPQAAIQYNTMTGIQSGRPYRPERLFTQAVVVGHQTGR